MVINPKENRCSYWNDNFVHGCPKNTFAMSFRKKEWKANFSNPATPSGLSYIRADFPWTFRKPTITQNFEKIFFFKIGTLSTIIFFEEKIALKNPIIQIQNVVKQAKGNVTPECYQLILFFIACLTMEKLLPRVGQSFIYSSAIQDHSLKQRGSQTSGNTIESFIFLSIYTF